MTKDAIQACLRICPLFRDFNDDELTQFVDLVDPMEVPGGATIVKQDDLGDSMYLVVTGQARVLHHRDSRTLELAILTPGEFFGELALVDHGLRSADVEAVGDTVLLQITQASISALAGVYPTAAFKFLITMGRILVERLRKSNQRYVDSLLFPYQGKD